MQICNKCKLLHSGKLAQCSECKEREAALDKKVDEILDDPKMRATFTLGTNSEVLSVVLDYLVENKHASIEDSLLRLKFTVKGEKYEARLPLKRL